MFIETERTPNPATLKFLPGQTVLESGSADFPDHASAQGSPLAAKLFEVDGVAGVFFGADFITVTAREDLDWLDLKPAVLGVIMEHLSAGLPVLDEAAQRAATVQDDPDADPDVIQKIRDLLDERVRPAVARDGGDIIYHGFRDGIVFLRMQGACAGCPSSTATLKYGIENLLKHYVPDVAAVEAV